MVYEIIFISLQHQNQNQSLTITMKHYNLDQLDLYTEAMYNMPEVDFSDNREWSQWQERDIECWAVDEQDNEDIIVRVAIRTWGDFQDDWGTYSTPACPSFEANAEVKLIGAYLAKTGEEVTTDFDPDALASEIAKHIEDVYKDPDNGYYMSWADDSDFAFDLAREK